MMEKVYKTSKVKFITDIAIGAGAAAFIGLILTRFMDGLTKPIVIAAVLFILYAWMISWDKITVTLTDKELRIKQGKEEQVFDLEKTSFGSYIHTENDNTERYLLIGTEDGSELKICCTLLGANQFDELRNELGITGSKQKAVKLETKKK